MLHKKCLLKMSSLSYSEIASNTDCVGGTMRAVSILGVNHRQKRRGRAGVRWPPLAHIAAPWLWPSVSQAALFTGLYFSPTDGGRSSGAGLGN